VNQGDQVRQGNQLSRDDHVDLAAGAGRPAEPGQLAWFHGLPAADARELLLACCAAEPWAGRLIAGRPYPTVAALLRESDEAVASLTVPELAAALAGHPRIGEPVPAGRDPAVSRPPGPPGQEQSGMASAVSRPPGLPGQEQSGMASAVSRPPGWSRREQSGMAAADEPTRRAMAELNAAYERRFGHIYLVRATGRTADELLALLRARLGHDDATEWRTVRSELAQINRIRLRKLLAGAA
jgi:2-oxo-4-hydroxy-4-carboxy-5-ureidoimidazoline decarboxylase